MEVAFSLNYYLLLSSVLFIFIGALLYRELFRKKKYYKKIIDNSANVVMLVNKHAALEVNQTFFTYFKSFENLEQFSKKHNYICDFFEQEEGYLEVMNDGKVWFEYLVEKQDIKHKAKLNIDGEIHYFLISASNIDEKYGVYAIILADISEQVEAKQALTRLTLNDSLTNIGNRRFFDTKLQEHVTLGQRYSVTFSLMLLDIDFFKKINDNFGHDIGDKVLIEFSEILKKNLREGDVFARVGGEEFVILLPLTSKDKAHTLAEKLRILIQESKDIATPITMSVGLVEYEKGDDEKSVFKRADDVLYKAKEAGRNKVVVG